MNSGGHYTPDEPFVQIGVSHPTLEKQENPFALDSNALPGHLRHVPQPFWDGGHPGASGLQEDVVRDPRR
jgi:hypothetical protein